MSKSSIRGLERKKSPTSKDSTSAGCARITQNSGSELLRQVSPGGSWLITEGLGETPRYRQGV